MRAFFLVSTFLCVIVLAFWAYQENFKTQKAIAEVETLQRQIGRAQARLTMLRAEWAYLNRPDRLRALADINFDRLGLLPFNPDQYGRIDQVAFPDTGVSGAGQDFNLDLSNAVDVSNLKAQP